MDLIYETSNFIVEATKFYRVIRKDRAIKEIKKQITLLLSSKPYWHY